MNFFWACQAFLLKVPSNFSSLFFIIQKMNLKFENMGDFWAKREAGKKEFSCWWRFYNKISKIESNPIENHDIDEYV